MHKIHWLRVSGIAALFITVVSCGSDSNMNSSDMTQAGSCVTEPAPVLACSAKAFDQASSHCEIINSTSTGVSGIEKTAVLPLRNPDCSLPPLP